MWEGKKEEIVAIVMGFGNPVYVFDVTPKDWNI